ncbi:MAG: hypothetical protein ACI9U5_001087 [Colwellia sp.]|jgi:hypothetical protein
MTDSRNDEIERQISFRLDMEKELVEIFWVDEKGQKYNKSITCLDFLRGG